jgi:uncharacterized membrane protein YfcA
MESQFLGVPDMDAFFFAAFALAAFCTNFLGTVTGSIGGLMLLAILALKFPPAILIPVHTMVQLGTGCSRVIIMWRYVMRGTLLPFLLGAIAGAAAGAQIFVVLHTAVLQAVIGGGILLFTWLPKIARAGAEHHRFAVLGFVTTFVGMFVSATGTMLSPFVASAAPDRRNHVSTFACLMSMVHLTKFIAFVALGIGVAAYTPLIIAMVAAGALGNWVGSRVLNHIPERNFRVIFQILLTVLAVRLLWTAARDGGLI